MKSLLNAVPLIAILCLPQGLNAADPTVETAATTTAKTAAKTAEKTAARAIVPESKGRAELSVWSMICENPAIAISALASATGLTCDGVRYHIRKLKAAGRLKRIGGTNGGRWEVLK